MKRRSASSLLATAIVALLTLGCAGGGSGPEAGRGGPPIRFGIWGDTPYRDAEREAVPALIDQMNAANLDVSIFVGDLSAGACADRHYTAAVDNFNRSTAPLVYTPGDNEWTDCHERDPFERLAFLRTTMFPTANSFGRNPIALEQQRPGYPENSRWRLGSVLFVAVHVPGSNNNHFADPDAVDDISLRPAQRRAAEAEYRARDEADRAWLRDSFEIARREAASAVVVAMHADPGFDVPPPERARLDVDGYDRLLAALVAGSTAFGKPVLVVHGDTHRFVEDQPLIDPATGEALPNVTRVETFGSPDVGWVEITIDPGTAAAPRVEPHLVRGP